MQRLELHTAAALWQCCQAFGSAKQEGLVWDAAPQHTARDTLFLLLRVPAAPPRLSWNTHTARHSTLLAPRDGCCTSPRKLLSFRLPAACAVCLTSLAHSSTQQGATGVHRSPSLDGLIAEVAMLLLPLLQLLLRLESTVMAHGGAWMA